MADRRLQVFYTVARLLSFTRAAETLHMTQPAVTFQVRQLEQQFDTRLFDRTHNRVTLTQAGRKTYEYAERIFELYAELENSLHALGGGSCGSLALGASTTVAEYLLPALLRRFKRDHREVHLDLKVSDTAGIVSMVENSMIDLALVAGAVTERNLLVELCQVDQFAVIVQPGHRLADQQAISLETLLDQPFVCGAEGSRLREKIMNYMDAQHLDRNSLNICLELGSLESIKGAVEAGIGFAILPRAAIAKELELGSLACVSLDPPLEQSLSFVRQRQNVRLPAVEELLALARDYCKDQAQTRQQRESA